MKPISVLVPIVAGAGVVLVWSAVHGAHITVTVKDLLAGRAPHAAATDTALVAVDAATAATSGTEGVSAAPAAGVGTNPAANRANGQLQAAAHGWIGEQWTALDKLWTRESGWNNLVTNPS